MTDKISAYLTVRAWKMKEAFRDFWEEEKGGTGVIEVVLILVVVVGLAVIFRNQIGELVGRLWKDIIGKTSDYGTDLPGTGDLGGTGGGG